MSELNESKCEVEMKASTDLEGVIGFLEDLTTSLKAGKVYVQHGSDIVTLKPNKNVQVAVRAYQREHKEKLQIELTWRHLQGKAFSDLGLKVSSADPSE